MIETVGAGSGALGPPADRRPGSIKGFAFELGNAGRVGVSLPTQLRQRQWVMARVAHVLRWPSEERAHFSSWSAASIKRMASTRNWSDRALAWIFPPAAELVRQQDSLRRGVQHLAQVLQGMRGSVCVDPVTWPADSTQMPSPRRRSQIIRSGSQLIRSKSQLFRSSTLGPSVEAVAGGGHRGRRSRAS